MRNRRFSLITILATSLLTAVLVTAAPTVAGVGDALLLGRSNSAGNKTTAASANVSTGPAFKFSNNAVGNRAALRIDTKNGVAPPFATNSDRKVVNFNADKLDDFDSSDFLRKSEIEFASTVADVNPTVGTTKTISVQCPSGTAMLSGGGGDDPFVSTGEVSLVSLTPAIFSVNTMLAEFGRLSGSGPVSAVVWASCAPI